MERGNTLKFLIWLIWGPFFRFTSTVIQISFWTSVLETHHAEDLATFYSDGSSYGRHVPYEFLTKLRNCRHPKINSRENPENSRKEDRDLEVLKRTPSNGLLGTSGVISGWTSGKFPGETPRAFRGRTLVDSGWTLSRITTRCSAKYSDRNPEEFPWEIFAKTPTKIPGKTW